MRMLIKIENLRLNFLIRYRLCKVNFSVNIVGREKLYKLG